MQELFWDPITCPWRSRYAKYSDNQTTTKTGGIVDKGNKAVVLLSGGLDSTTTLAMAKARGFEPYAVSVCTRQRHAAGLDAARRVAEHIGVARQLILDLDPLGCGERGFIPQGSHDTDTDNRSMPICDAIFVSFALAWIDLLAKDFFICVNQLDSRTCPDCPPEYLEVYRCLVGQADRPAGWGASQITVHTPLADLIRPEIIEQGARLGLDCSLTFSCRDPSPEGEPCEQRHPSLGRRQTFSDAGIPDPSRYEPARYRG
jgi:7-cyano-7-deazaguanine synthase